MKLDSIQYFENVLKYLTRFTIGNNIEDKLEFLCGRIYGDIEKTMNKIKSMIYFSSFYYFISHMLKNKHLNKKENLKDDLNKFMSKLNAWILIEKKSVAPALNEILFSKDMVEELEEVVGKKEFQNLVGNEERFEKDFARVLRNSLIDTIISICELLENIGVMDELLERSNRKLDKINLSFLKIKLENTSKNNNNNQKNSSFIPVTLHDNYSRKWLELQNLQILTSLMLFWVNKLSKFLESLVQIILILSENIPILIGITRGEVQSDVVRYWYKDNMDNNKSKYINMIHKIDSGDDFEYPCIGQLKLLIDVCYISKSLATFGALNLAMDTSLIKNFGVYIPNTKSNNNLMVLSFDIPRYNLPLTIHIDTEKLRYFIKEFRKDSKIKCYLGNEEFNLQDRRIGTSVLYYITPEQREKIKKRKDRNKFLAHLDFIQRGIWPKHLRDEKGKVKKIYINI